MEDKEAARTVELLNAVLSGTDVGATVQAPSDRVIYANAAAAAIIGFDSAADLVAAPGPEVLAWFEVFYPDAPRFLPISSRVVQRSKESHRPRS
ncbi:hypothetical protein BH11MYX1_BH11MYX1_42210 [soil metagenome]